MFWRKVPKDAKPEWLIVGLGNPGAEYRDTRHNVGFVAVDRLAERLKARLDRSKHRARFGMAKIGDTPVLLAKPLTFMNLSGQAVGPLAREYGLAPDRVLVLADDLDTPLGKVKLKPKGGSGGQNGHKSIIQALRTEDYPRVKIGIGAAGKADAVEHVLSPFEPDERLAIQEAIELAVQACLAVVEQGLARALSVANLPD